MARRYLFTMPVESGDEEHVHLQKNQQERGNASPQCETPFNPLHGSSLYLKTRENASGIMEIGKPNPVMILPKAWWCALLSAWRVAMPAICSGRTPGSAGEATGVRQFREPAFRRDPSPYHPIAPLPSPQGSWGEGALLDGGVQPL